MSSSIESRRPTAPPSDRRVKVFVKFTGPRDALEDLDLRLPTIVKHATEECSIGAGSIPEHEDLRPVATGSIWCRPSACGRTLAT